jgi:murein DD-endopeptidase MepM/ murein hydrolase activator NlpD
LILSRRHLPMTMPHTFRSRITGDPLTRMTLVFGLLIILLAPGVTADAATPMIPAAAAPALSMPVPGGAQSSLTASDEVQRGQTLSAIIRSHDLSPTLIPALLDATEGVFDLTRIKPGMRYELWTIEGSGLAALTYQIDDQQYLLAQLADEGTWRAEIRSYPYRWVERVARGEVTWSFFAAAEKAEIPTEGARSFVDVFSWTVDFIRDLQTGDSFELLLREKEILGTGHRTACTILAVRFACAGKEHRAFRYEADPEQGPEYFDGEGTSMRKEFLKAPLTFTRISSRYSRSRLHPVLHRKMPHHGVDYAAPTGTPVVSTADGTVTMAGRDRGGGKMVRIRHNSRVTTAYLHFSRFAKGIRKGVRVRQGQVIGYVGQTGLASGPHCDYRIMIDGRWVNPLKVDFPPATSVPGEQMEPFTRWRNQLLAHLNESTPN